MEKKNTVLLTVIAVATLLVAVVGATFAYFTATAETNNGTSGTVDATTANVAGATLEIKSVAGKSYLNYPGGVGYSGVTLQAIKADDDDSDNEYDLKYQLELTYTNTTGTNLTYKVYKVASVTDPACKAHVDTTSQAGETRYYYSVAGEADKADPTDCTVGLSNDDLVASGTLAQSSAAGSKLTISNGTTAVDFTSMTTATTPDTYYLVVEYPNSGDQSTSDMGQTISAQITGVVDTPTQALHTTP